MANTAELVGQTQLHANTGVLLRDLRERGVRYIIHDRWGRPFAELRPIEPVQLGGPEELIINGS